MNTVPFHVRVLTQTFLCGLFLAASTCFAGHYTNFDVSIYIPVGLVRGFAQPGTLSNQWAVISRQLAVDKVYIEAQRDRTLAGDDVLEQTKKFFLDHGVQVAGGMALSDGSIGGQFKSFCYTDPNDRAFVKSAVELAARHFDEIIQDDFFFVTTKTDSDIASKGDRSWTQFRIELMREVSENLLLKPARAINPKVKMVIKYPNWYEHFQGLGFDLDQQPKMFDGIYTGTESRDPEITDQNLQQYESYQIIRYFENIKPGGNGGGWVDTFSIRYIDRYAEQLWDTLFAKAPEMMLFNWSALLQPIRPGERSAWETNHTSFDYSELLKATPEPTMARAAGYAVESVDPFLGKLGHPIGVECYKPFQSTGEDFLHNYLGMIGIPIDLHPAFPTNANLVLLTECAKFDPDIVKKIKAQLAAGKSVVITSGLLRALQGKGIEDIAEIRYTDHKILSHQYLSAFGAGNSAPLTADKDQDVLWPEIEFLTNDSWALLRSLANGRGYPLMLMNRYSKGILYVWAMPENFNDLYRLPPDATSAIKNYVMPGFPIRLDGPSQVALFAYDNNTCVVESYLPGTAEVRVSAAGEFTKLRNLVTGEVISAQAQNQGFRRGRGPQFGAPRSTFPVHLLPHSYAPYALEK